MDASFDAGAGFGMPRETFSTSKAVMTARDVQPLVGRIAPILLECLEGQCAELRESGQINRAAAIEIDDEVTEAWQERGRDFVTVAILGTPASTTWSTPWGEFVELFIGAQRFAEHLHVDPGPGRDLAAMAIQTGRTAAATPASCGRRAKWATGRPAPCRRRWPAGWRWRFGSWWTPRPSKAGTRASMVFGRPGMPLKFSGLSVGASSAAALQLRSLGCRCWRRTTPFW